MNVVTALRRSLRRSKRNKSSDSSRGRGHSASTEHLSQQEKGACREGGAEEEEEVGVIRKEKEKEEEEKQRKESEKGRDHKSGCGGEVENKAKCDAEVTESGCGPNDGNETADLLLLDTSAGTSGDNGVAALEEKGAWPLEEIGVAALEEKGAWPMEEISLVDQDLTEGNYVSQNYFMYC